MNRLMKSICLLIGVLCTVIACSRTQLTIRTDPTGASIKLYSKSGLIHEGASDIVDYNFDDLNQQQVFGDNTSGTLGLAIDKKGYRPFFGIKNVVKGEQNHTDIIKLEALNTDIQLDVDPPGAKAILYESLQAAEAGSHTNGVVSIPLGESFSGDYAPQYVVDNFPDFARKYKSQIKFDFSPELTLPWGASYTENTARAELAKVKAIRVEAEDYVPKVEEFSIRPGQSIVKSYRLKKMNTVLKVLGDSEGIEIEDTMPAPAVNFGYMGKTPLVRQFSFQEAMRETEFRNSRAVKLKLRAYKAGYVDQKIDVTIPWGEETTVKVSLKPRSNQITFQSDPDGVHVYVVRKKTEERYIKEDNKWEKTEIKVYKHLGATPFTYTDDPADPLEHNDEIVFKKPGYDEASDNFALGISSYHKVLRPEKVKER